MKRRLFFLLSLLSAYFVFPKICLLAIAADEQAELINVLKSIVEFNQNCKPRILTQEDFKYSSSAKTIEISTVHFNVLIVATDVWIKPKKKLALKSPEEEKIFLSLLKNANEHSFDLFKKWYLSILVLNFNKLKEFSTNSHAVLWTQIEAAKKKNRKIYLNCLESNLVGGLRVYDTVFLSKFSELFIEEIKRQMFYFLETTIKSSSLIDPAFFAKSGDFDQIKIEDILLAYDTKGINSIRYYLAVVFHEFLHWLDTDSLYGIAHNKAIKELYLKFGSDIQKMERFDSVIDLLDRSLSYFEDTVYTCSDLSSGYYERINNLSRLFKRAVELNKGAEVPGALKNKWFAAYLQNADFSKFDIDVFNHQLKVLACHTCNQMSFNNEENGFWKNIWNWINGRKKIYAPNARSLKLDAKQKEQILNTCETFLQKQWGEDKLFPKGIEE